MMRKYCSAMPHLRAKCILGTRPGSMLLLVTFAGVESWARSAGWAGERKDGAAARGVPPVVGIAWGLGPGAWCLGPGDWGW